MEKKEFYKNILPHFQLPGQAYFVTWILKDAVPRKALKYYDEKLEILKSQLGMAELGLSGGFVQSLENEHAVKNRISPSFQKTILSISEIEKLKKEYYLLRRKYKKAYDDLLHLDKNTLVDLSKPSNTKIIKESLCFWEEKKLRNFAFCIMSNHVHWVFQLLEKDSEGELVYLQDIMHSVKRFSSNRINKLENREGVLWQKESFDTTIRNERHLYNAIEYTLNNPVAARLVKNRNEWGGSKDFLRF